MKKVTKEIITTYDASLDKTIIWEETYLDDDVVSSEIVGWYCGESNEHDTQEYAHTPLLCVHDIESIKKDESLSDDALNEIQSIEFRRLAQENAMKNRV